MAKQEVTFNQSDWSNEEKVTTQKADIKGILAQLFGWLLRAVLFVIATPFYIVIWTINFIKSLFGMFVMWVVGKFCIFLFLAMLGGLFHNLLGWVSEETVESVIEWYSINIMGMGPAPDTAESFFMFPHFNIEVWIIVILALIMATFSTIYRDEL